MDGETRVGWGFDAHRFGGEGPLLLGGVEVDPDRGVVAHSDGDVVAHAVCDALLGAGALGDLGAHFPSSDPSLAGVSSLHLLRQCLAMAEAAGILPVFVDVTVMAARIPVAPHRDAIREGLASVLGLEVGSVSVKATTCNGMGFVGRDEGVAAAAAVTVRVLGP